MAPAAGRRPVGANSLPGGSLSSAGRRLLETYAGLAERGEHLLHAVLGGQAPTQWAHYPDDDAIDGSSGYQWFYHSHSPEDRPDAGEHGHFHLFARRPLWSRRLNSASEREFATLTGAPDKQVKTRHLIGIGLDAKGLPVSLFTVNSWVTGDLMLGAANTERLLMGMSLDTGYAAIDTMLECVMALCQDEIHALLATRDRTLASRKSQGLLEDRSVEVLSEVAIDIDAKLNQLMAHESP